MSLSTDRQAQKKKMDIMQENNVWLKKPWVRKLRLAVQSKPHYFWR